jgi:uncharacterized membrane protein HdeD (DUF308 family)
MKTVLVVLGVALFILGIQDAIRLFVDASQRSIFSWIPGDVSLYIALDVALAICGSLLVKYAPRITLKPSAQ